MRKTILRSIALLLVLALVGVGLLSCSNRGKTLMYMEKDGVRVTISVNIYELMLSRMKGVLANGGFTQNGATPESDAFWNYISKFDGTNEQTLDEYYRACIQDNCRTYLVALYLFETLDLQLSSADLEEIDKRMDELLRTDGEGSKTKLNSVLSAYGVNYDILKEAYTIEKKVSAVQTKLYGENASLIGDDIKTEYMEENYVHFRQIFLPTYKYLCKTDENGDTIYYHSSGDKQGHIYYDTHNGVVGYNEDGSLITDTLGDTVYFLDDGNYKSIAYDSTNGAPEYLMDEKDATQYKTEQITDEKELKALEEKVNSLLASLTAGDYTGFEKAIEKEVNRSAPSNDLEEHPDGYYLDRKVDYSASGSEYQYLTDIINKLDTMQDGEIALIPSSFGYHIVMKYPYTEKAYASETNTVWFENFNSALIEDMFLKECKKHYDSIHLDEAVLSDAPNMKEVEINRYLI